MEKVTFKKIAILTVMIIGLTVLPGATVNGQSDNIGINGKVKTKKPISKRVTDQRRCIYPMCGGVLSPTNPGEVQRRRKPNALTGDSGRDWFLKANGNKMLENSRKSQRNAVFIGGGASTGARLKSDQIGSARRRPK